MEYIITAIVFFIVAVVLAAELIEHMILAAERKFRDSRLAARDRQNNQPF
jgi:hypothetical protein